MYCKHQKSIQKEIKNKIQRKAKLTIEQKKELREKPIINANVCVFENVIIPNKIENKKLKDMKQQFHKTDKQQQKNNCVLSKPIIIIIILFSSIAKFYLSSVVYRFSNINYIHY